MNAADKSIGFVHEAMWLVPVVRIVEISNAKDCYIAICGRF